MLKTVVLHKLCVEFSDKYKVEKICKITHVFTVPFEQFYASLQNKC